MLPAEDGQPPADDRQVGILEALAWQRQYVAEAGSPTAALLLEAVATAIRAGDPIADLIEPRQRFGDLPGLRIMAAVHRLAIDRKAPLVARWLPTLGGTPPTDAAGVESFRRAVVGALGSHPQDLAASLAHVPQTNETGRAALLRCVLSRLEPQRPVRLYEIGASAGLNLRADRLPGTPALEAGAMPAVVERVGCDLEPVDISTPEGRSLLSSYVWVDDVDRFRRLGRAMAVARAVPATLVRMDAASFCADLAAVPATTTVLWHSAMWLYLPEAVQQEVVNAIARAASLAGPDRPLVHASWERSPATALSRDFSLVTRTWDGSPGSGRPVLLATGMSHGHPAELVTPPVALDADPLLHWVR